MRVRAGSAVDVPVCTAHRAARVVEVQHGDYFGEDDIVCLEDDYGRAPPSPAAP